MSRRNRIPLTTYLDGQPISHFSLHEFENGDGLAVVHPCLLESLERTRAALGVMFGEEVRISVTDATRTQADLEALAADLGWIDEGGAVSRDSQHLSKHGGIAVDIVATFANSGGRVDQRILGNACREWFDFVKDDYGDGHVHADNRSRAD